MTMNVPLALLLSLSGASHRHAALPKLVSDGLAGYVSMEVPPNSDEFGYGISLYASAWPLLAKPLRDFQIGLASIWIVPDNRSIEYPLLPKGTVARDNWPERGPSYRDVFQTIEGGLGFWANTRYWTQTSKFRMNGTPNGYNHEISSPGWGFGGSGADGDAKALAPNQMGIAQLSSHILVPPDGIDLKDPTIGDLFGYAWMVLPLTKAKTTTAGLPVTTGNQSWTLFLNTANFKGPVAFYIPSTWSRVSRNYAPAIGRGLDSRAGLVSGGAIEINTVPRFTSEASGSAGYSRIPRLQFPADKSGKTVLIHRMTQYSRAALYDSVDRWIEGGNPASGRFEAAGALTPAVKANPLEVSQGDPKVKIQGCEDWVKTSTFGDDTFGLQWNLKALSPWRNGVFLGAFPDYFRRDGDQLRAIPADQVPDGTGLKKAEFLPADDRQSYTSPEDPHDVWKSPGPKAGPFKVRLGDGSVMTYYWYRFIDQPSLQDAALTPDEKTRLQKVVEKIQSKWTSSRDYMAPPRIGRLASLDRGLLVNPPKGLEIGYVPIATGQTPPDRKR